MKKSNIIYISVIAGIALLSFMLWSAQKARTQSQKIMDDFKTVDNSLHPYVDTSVKYPADTLLQKDSVK